MNRARWLLLLIALVALDRCVCGGEPSPATLRLGTFNIENYPKSERQVQGAFDAIGSLGALAIGVQEITEPESFARSARHHLGDAWRFVYPETSPLQRVGVLFDGRRLELLSTQTHQEVAVYRGAKPAFEARLRSRSGVILRVIVVHLKAGGDFHDVRRRQLVALSSVAARAKRSGEQVVLLGDFNATSPQDRREIARLARTADLSWASEPLDCTSYWNRRDGCMGTALDHVLTASPAEDVTARGPCESIGCNPGRRCPTFHEEVSDHCPVSVDVRARATAA